MGVGANKKMMHAFVAWVEQENIRVTKEWDAWDGTESSAVTLAELQGVRAKHARQKYEPKVIVKRSPSLEAYWLKRAALEKQGLDINDWRNYWP